MIDVYNDATAEYDQAVTIAGEVVTTYSSSKSLSSEHPHFLRACLLTMSSESGYAEGWGTACECQTEACKGSVNAHSKSFLP